MSVVCVARNPDGRIAIGADSRVSDGDTMLSATKLYRVGGVAWGVAGDWAPALAACRAMHAALVDEQGSEQISRGFAAIAEIDTDGDCSVLLAHAGDIWCADLNTEFVAYRLRSPFAAIGSGGPAACAVLEDLAGRVPLPEQRVTRALTAVCLQNNTCGFPIDVEVLAKEIG